jgi:hypothetical protein
MPFTARRRILIEDPAGGLPQSNNLVLFLL